MKRLFQASAAAAAVLLCASAPEAEPFENGVRPIMIAPAGDAPKQAAQPDGGASAQPLRTGRELRVDPAPPPAMERQRTAEGLGLRPAPAPEFAGGRPQERQDRPEAGLAERSSLEELRRYGDSDGGSSAGRQTEADRRLAEEVRREEAARARKEKEKRELRALRDELLDESIERLLPLEPDEIRSYRRRRDSVEGAVTPSPARMRTASRQISAVPGAAPQVIRVTGGYSSTIMFQDATGAPWPVLSVVLGDPRSFAVSQPRVTQETLYANDNASVTGNSNRSKMEAGTSNITSNIVNIVPLTNHSSSNLVVTLEGLPYPVVLHLLSESTALEERSADALVVFRLDKSGPQAKAPVVGPAIPGAVTEDVLSFVHGVAPKGAVRLKLTPGVPGVQMWRMQGMIYLRTMHQPVWPAWTASAAGDGVSVYVMPDSPSVVVSVGGQRVKMAVAKADD